MQDCFGRPSDLVGVGLVLLPLAMMRTAGRTGVPIRVPLSYGGGTLFIKAAMPATQLPVEGIADAVAASATPNKQGE